MQTLVKVIQRFTGGGDGEVAAGADKQKNLLVAQGNPPYGEIRRRGDGWTVFTSTPLAPLAALPTGTAHLELYNNGSRVAVVSDLHAYRLTATAVVQSAVIFAMITTFKAIPTLGAETLYSMTGKALEVPTVTSEMVTAIDSSVVANGWQPYGAPVPRALEVATPGLGWSVPIDGKLQIPPGASLCVTLCASVNTASSFHIGVTWDWVSMSIEA